MVIGFGITYVTRLSTLSCCLIGVGIKIGSEYGSEIILGVTGLFNWSVISTDSITGITLTALLTSMRKL